MARKFVRITEEDLRNRVTAIKDDDGDARDNDYNDGVDCYALFTVLHKDFKVRFDLENFGCTTDKKDAKSLVGIHTLSNGLTFWGMWGGGDWEKATFFLVYFDGKKLRVYIPTDGNPYNTDTMQAYGNDQDTDQKNMKKRYPKTVGQDDSDLQPDDAPDFDWAKIEEDIRGRIEEAK